MEQIEDCPHCPVGAVPLRKLKYSPLQGDKAIRLLELQAGQPNDDIHCKVLHSSLDTGAGYLWKLINGALFTRSPPTYTALSYVWGPPNFEDFILLNDGAHFHITRNLLAAFRALRAESETRVLWVDQICINQADNDEKSSQVQLMKDIFQQAKEVIGWLGEDDGDSVEAFRFARRLVEILIYVSTQNIEHEIQESLGELPEAYAKGNLIFKKLKNDQLGWNALIKIFQLPWFSRIWIVQEAALARTLTIQSGTQQLPWIVVEKLVSMIEKFPNVRPKVLGVKSSVCVGMLVRAVRRLKTADKIELLGLLKVSSAHESTDPRDKIYALLGLLKSSDPSGIVPRYDRPAHLVFQQVTRAMITAQKSFAVWNTFHNSPCRRQLGLSSWCPDWSIVDTRIKMRLFKGWKHFKADQVCPASLKWHGDPNILTLRGKLIDKITDKRIYLDVPPVGHGLVAEPNTLVAATLNHFRCLARLLQSCRALYDSTLSDDCNLVDFKENHWRAWRAMVGGLRDDGNLVNGKYFQYYQDYEKYIQHAGSVSAYEHLKLIDHAMSPDRIKGIAAYSRAVLEAGEQRQFTVTENGRLGWVPEWVQTDDRVAIIHGCRLPAVIRPRQDGLWTWISICYLDGVMFGEAMKDDCYATEDITLC